MSVRLVVGAKDWSFIHLTITEWSGSTIQFRWALQAPARVDLSGILGTNVCYLIDCVDDKKYLCEFSANVSALLFIWWFWACAEHGIHSMNSRHDIIAVIVNHFWIMILFDQLRGVHCPRGTLGAMCHSTMCGILLALRNVKVKYKLKNQLICLSRQQSRMLNMFLAHTHTHTRRSNAIRATDIFVSHAITAAIGRSRSVHVSGVCAARSNYVLHQ